MTAQMVYFEEVVKIGCGLHVHKATISTTIRRSTKFETMQFEIFPIKYLYR